MIASWFDAWKEYEALHEVTVLEGEYITTVNRPTERKMIMLSLFFKKVRNNYILTEYEKSILESERCMAIQGLDEQECLVKLSDLYDISKSSLIRILNLISRKLEYQEYIGYIN